MKIVRGPHRASESEIALQKTQKSGGGGTPPSTDFIAGQYF